MRYLNERDELPIDKLPRKPQPSVTTSSHHEPKRSSRHHATEDSRRPRYERADPSGYSTERTRSSSRERRRRERRAARYAENPEEELRRRECRHARKAEREQRHADRQQRRAEIEAQRAERDERRQRRREAEAGQPDQTSRSNEQRELPIETSQTTDQSNSQSNTVPREIKQSEAIHQERGPDTAPDPQDLDLEHGRQQTPWQSKRYYSGPPPRADSWESYSSDYYDDEKYPDSVYDEEKYYQRRSTRGRYEYEDSRSCCACRRRWCILGSIAATIIGLIIIIVVAVVASRSQFKYTPSSTQVNSTAAFRSGGATQNSVNDTKDGIGAGTDVYRYYQGNATNFPNHTLWISFEDMWNNNLDNIRQSCGWLSYGSDDSDQEIQNIYNGIQDRANASLVDHRFILALVLQESHGCVRVPHTTSSGGVKNTGLMQAHDGHEYNSHHSQQSILTMIQDGTQGTKKGDGLVQLLNVYGNPYSAARGYNSGYVPTSGDLSEEAGATACYVSDVANRLTGWVNAKSSCPGAS